MKWKIPLYKIFTDEDDIKAISKVIKRGYDWTLGNEISMFENLLRNYIGMKYCLLFNSGTSALHASLLAADIKPNDRIIVPSFTFIATTNSVLMANGTPTFADIEEETYGLDPKDVEKRITKTTKAVIPIHYAGLPCKIDEIQKIKKSYLLKMQQNLWDLQSIIK